MNNHFYGVYLLNSDSDDLQFINKNYIGFTVDPKRRIIQHNKGSASGGARKTNNKGPWKIILIVHGFPNKRMALQFEWAWQHPHRSRSLRTNKSLNRRPKSESFFNYNFRILTEMLTICPWKRLPLIVRWLSPEFVRAFPVEQSPPMHMRILNDFTSDIITQLSQNKKKTNRTKSPKKIIIANDNNDDNNIDIVDNELFIMDDGGGGDNNLDDADDDDEDLCKICFDIIENVKQSKVKCINGKCTFYCHIICLAKHCLQIVDTTTTTTTIEYVPIDGDCPRCGIHFLWGDLIRNKHNGMQKSFENSLSNDDKHNDDDDDDDDIFIS